MWNDILHDIHIFETMANLTKCRNDDGSWSIRRPFYHVSWCLLIEIRVLPAKLYYTHYHKVLLYVAWAFYVKRGDIRIRKLLILCNTIPYILMCFILLFKVCGNAYSMMTSSNGNIFRVTGHLCGEFTGPRCIPCTKASDSELWCFLWSASE